MRIYQDKEISIAISLRKEKGYSFAELQRRTGIPATTIRNWCRGETIASRQDTLLLSNDRKRIEIKQSELASLDSLGTLSPTQVKVYLSLLYWCEGTKYPASNKMIFTNSDPSLIKLFLTLLRQAFPIDETKLRIHLQLHTIHDFSEIRTYWSKLLSIPPEKFIKPTITELRGGKHRRTYLGTCSLRYYDFTLQLKLIGLYEELIKRSESFFS